MAAFPKESPRSQSSMRGTWGLTPERAFPSPYRGVLLREGEHWRAVGDACSPRAPGAGLLGGYCVGTEGALQWLPGAAVS